MKKQHNPYQSPDAEIYLKLPPKKGKNLWKAFFVISFLLYLIALFFILDFIRNDPLITTFDLIIDTLLLTGLYGFAFDRKLLFKGFWIVLLISAMGIDAYDYFANGFVSSDAGELFVFYLAISLFLLTVSFIQYLALFMYSFSSDDIWRQEKNMSE
ncbi:hypothetical protein FLL45_12960 [Aliikangiella marina]|uniref:Uncharacterized protein n=1 Tax=Aliikangiella marina TaxID=1712262 RepID=A0A545T979_9GAMM|nr:hypothetical protein [Aliikangiella marina]TQV73773.1 hypothetical protein FLL45_12960 [Aliikangiella marina]